MSIEYQLPVIVAAPVAPGCGIGQEPLLATTAFLNVFAVAAGMVTLLAASHTLVATVLHPAA